MKIEVARMKFEKNFLKIPLTEIYHSSDYKISNKGAGEDGLGVANLVVQWQNRKFHGYGIATDVIEASGTFSQTGYIPHKTSHIDTVFQMLDFSLCEKHIPELWYAGRQYLLPDMVWMQ